MLSVKASSKKAGGRSSAAATIRTNRRANESIAAAYSRRLARKPGRSLSAGHWFGPTKRRPDNNSGSSGGRSRPAGGIVRDIDDRDRLAHARLQRKGNGIMAQIAARLLRNLGFLFKACGEPLEAVGERQQLLAAARLEPHFLGDAPEPHGDLAKMCDPILRKVLGHRHRLPPSATL